MLNHHNPSQSLHADFLHTFGVFASRDIWTVPNFVWMIFFSSEVSNTLFRWRILIWACLCNMLHLLTDGNRFVRFYLSRGCAATHTTSGCWETAGIDRTTCWGFCLMRRFLSFPAPNESHSSNHVIWNWSCRTLVTVHLASLSSHTHNQRLGILDKQWNKLPICFSSPVPV